MSESNITKRALAATMKQLMETTPFCKISVSDICEACGMHRKSFYYHFKDKYDLVNWIFYHDFIELSVREGPDSFPELYRNLCSYFYENRVFYKNAFSVTGQNSFRDYYKELFEATAKAWLEEAYPEPDRLDRLTRYYAEISLTTIIKWLDESPCPPPEVYFALIGDLLDGLSIITEGRISGEQPS
ncbi:MAG: TetR/AcrR family transcriptional regulator C-terminal domain-containing protein [Oscillospiraceae bacterium]|jgi:probable dihydroxyacetone kinase regulator